MKPPLPGIVVCLHGIWESNEPSSGSANISTARLEELLSLLATMTHVVPLADLLERIERGRSTLGLSAITFDDAYLSMRDLALPLLGAPSGPGLRVRGFRGGAGGGPVLVGSHRGSAPENAGGAVAKLEDDSGLPKNTATGNHMNSAPLRPMRQWILAEHRGRLTGRVAEGLTRLEDELGWRTPQRSMTMGELRSLSRHELISFGVHTQTHAALALLPDAEVRQEIDTCYDQLRDEGIPVLPVLAAPFGLVDSRTGRLAAESGMRSTLLVSARSLWGRVATSAVPRMMMSEPRQGFRLLLNLTGTADAGRTLLGRRSPLAPPLPSPTT